MRCLAVLLPDICAITVTRLYLLISTNFTASLLVAPPANNIFQQPGHPRATGFICFTNDLKMLHEFKTNATVGKKIDIRYNNRILTVEDALFCSYAYITQLKSETNFLELIPIKTRINT